MRALEWTGVAHLDLRVDGRSGAVTVIEANPRFWGSVLGSLHAGVNFPYLTCLASLGQPFEAPGFRACRYVSGAGAVEQWLRGRLGTKYAGFGFSDTVFRYVLSDPWPTVAETLLSGS
jgi:D-aspartate ligase